MYLHRVLGDIRLGFLFDDFFGAQRFCVIGYDLP